MKKQGIACLFFLTSTMAFASVPSTSTDITETGLIDAGRNKESVIQVSKERQAQAWGLTIQEWDRFESIKASPASWEMTKSNPLSVLGRSARTSQERRKYAEMLVHYEKNMADGLLTFTQARRVAWKRLYPDLPIVKSSFPQRVMLFVSKTCTSCDQAIRDWRRKGATVDIYMVDSLGDDKALRQWAMKAGIRKADVDEGDITLNHDKGNWVFLAKGRTMPVSMAKNKDGQWTFVTP